MTSKNDKVIASNRLGFGAKPGDLVRIGNEPKQWLISQLKRPQALSRKADKPESSKSAFKSYLEFRNKKRDQKRSRNKKVNDVADVMNLSQAMRSIYLNHVMVRSIQATESGTPLFGRLVYFWSNHFAVSADKPQLYGMVGGWNLRPFGQM